MINLPLPSTSTVALHFPNIAVSAPHHLGKEFVVSFMQNGLQQTLNSDFKLLIRGYSPFTSITISMKKPGLRMTVQVTTGQTVLVKIPPQAEMVGSKTFENAVVVKANNPISLVAINEKPTSVDSTVVYPLHSWGTEYQIVTPNVGTDRYGEFTVVAWDEPTTVEVHLKATVTYQGQSYPRGSVLPIQLKPFQAAQLQSPADMSGTRVMAQKPVAVFTGHTCLARLTQCDHLVEQLQPVSSWGNTFIVPPLPFDTQSDIVYVSTSQSTHVESQHGMSRSARNLRAGRSTLYGLQAPNTLYLSANAGIQVIAFGDGGNKDSITYDPFFMTIPDVSSYCLSHNVFALEGYENYVLLIVKTSEVAGIMLNKMPLGNTMWVPIPGTEYSWARQSLGSQFAVHTVEHKTSPFGALSMGIREQKSYGLLAVCDSGECPTPTSTSLFPSVSKMGQWRMAKPHQNGFLWVGCLWRSLSIPAASAKVSKHDLLELKFGFSLVLQGLVALRGYNSTSRFRRGYMVNKCIPLQLIRELQDCGGWKGPLEIF